MAKIKVCDAIMGHGKTTAAINFMNANPERKFVYITPYLEEIKRIKSSCPALHFLEPRYTPTGNKSENFVALLESGHNVASTHALFKRCSPEIASLIENHGYTLILDEVCDVVEAVDVPVSDFNLFRDAGVISNGDDGHLMWNKDDYGKDGLYTALKKAINDGKVLLTEDNQLTWMFDQSIFNAFQEVIILTYMFDAQLQKYYFDYNGIPYELIGVQNGVNGYEFGEYNDACHKSKYNLKEIIHILEDNRLNEQGKEPNFLSAGWCSRQEKDNKKRLNRIRLDAENVVRNRWKAKAEQVLWSAHKNMQDELKGKGYASSFLAFNCRATNEHRKRTHLMYLINVYPTVDITTFFYKYGISIDRDQYATSVMVQWIWRSAVRDGKDIWVYIPSSRMRNLLKQWIDKVSAHS